MFRVVECIASQHQHAVIFLAALVWAFGSIAFFVLLKRSMDCVEQRRRKWLITASCMAGFGVWATHFIAMMAYDGGMPLSFGPGLTLVSLLFVVMGFGASMQILGRHPDWKRSITAGLITGSGIAAMHFTGMEAIIAPAQIRYEMPAVIIALFLVSISFSSAFHVFYRLHGVVKILIPAGFSIFGVLALHFIAMSATVLIPDPTQGLSAQHSSPDWLVIAIAAVTLAMIVALILSAIVDKMLTDLRGLTDATLEGLAIVSQDRIIEVNRQLASLLGVSIENLLRSSPDHWLKPVDGKSLSAARDHPVEATLRHHVPANADEAEMVVEIGTHSIEYRGKQCQVLAVRDLTARKKAERRVEHMAGHDALTDLPNRTHFTDVLEQLCKSGESFALHALDLDRFKAVNDLFGHAAGDIILCRVAALLRSSARHRDLVARIGGDEFLVIQRDVRHVQDAEQLAQRILAAFASEMDITRDPMAVGVSIGVAVFPRDASTPDMLRHHADFALYRAKQAGRGIARFFDQDMDRAARDQRALEHDLRHAITHRQLRLLFQPLVANNMGHVIGYEALLRWDHPTRGSVPPSQFVPIAEDIGAIIPIGEWALREACLAALHWPDHVSVAVNVSAVQFQLPNLPALVAAILEETGLSPTRLDLEVTESVMLRDRVSALDILHRLKAIGVGIVMDDFGTGYSSLSNLQAFPFDKIKIDRSFVSQLTTDESARSILRAIAGLGRSLDLPVVAEGVETEAQHKIVMEENCPQAQGFYFGAPAEAVTDYARLDRAALSNAPRLRVGRQNETSPLSVKSSLL